MNSGKWQGLYTNKSITARVYQTIWKFDQTKKWLLPRFCADVQILKSIFKGIDHTQKIFKIGKPSEPCQSLHNHNFDVDLAPNCFKMTVFRWDDDDSTCLIFLCSDAMTKEHWLLQKLFVDVDALKSTSSSWFYHRDRRWSQGSTIKAPL